MTTNTDKLIWVCDACQRPIADGKGAVFFRNSDLRAYCKGQAELKRKEQVIGPDPKTGRSLVITNVADLLEAAVPAPWLTMHHKCDKTPGDCRYWFDVARVRTLPAVLSWTRHLMGKRWFMDTAWDDLIGRVLHG